MKWKTSEEREYYEKYEKVDLENDQSWFECYRLPGNVYAICEPQHFQEVNSFLIVGSQRAILFDTGMGICDIKRVVDELYQGELIVVNSHFHFDHIGDNWQFGRVIVSEDRYVRAVAKNGIPRQSLGNQMDEDMFLFDYPLGFDGKEFHIKPYDIAIGKDGDLFDLGDRVLECVKTPGHSDDCVMLYDRTEDILFCGDMFYLGALYVHFNCGLFGESNLDTYAVSIAKVIDKFPEMKSVYVSHNDFVVMPKKLIELRDGLIQIREKAIDGTLLKNLNHGYLEKPKQLVEYNFDGFSIIVKE